MFLIISANLFIMKKIYNTTINKLELASETIMKLSLISAIILIVTFSLKAQNTKYSTEYFTKVEINNQANVTLINSDSCFVTIVTKDFNPDKFSYTVKDETISFDIKDLNNLSLDMIVGSPVFTEVKMKGASDLNGKTRLIGNSLKLYLSGASSANLELEYRTLTAKLSGASDVNITGEVDSIFVNTSGASDFNSFGAKTTYANVRASGASDVKVNPDSSIVADITGTSSLRYKNEPTNKTIGEDLSISIGDHNKIYVSDGEDTIRVKIGDRDTEIIVYEDGTPKITTNKKKENKFRGNWAGIELGVNGFLTPTNSLDLPAGYEFLELKYEKSTNFNLNFFQQSFGIFGNKFGFVTGLGLRWNNYRFSNNIVLSPDSTAIYGYSDQTSGRAYEKSKLTAWYLTMPLMFELQSNRHHDANSFHLTAGVIAGVRMGSHTKQIYTINGSGNHKPKIYDDFHLQPFILDATVRVGWGPLNLYGTYSIIEMFRNDRGPELYPFTIGIILPFT